MKKQKIKVAAAADSMNKLACSNCKKDFALSHDEYDYIETLEIRSCLSGGIYGVTIICPHCGDREDIQ